jgi:hypothetical protein
MMLMVRLLLFFFGSVCLLVTLPTIIATNGVGSFRSWAGLIFGTVLCITSFFEAPAGAVVSLYLLLGP